MLMNIVCWLVLGLLAGFFASKLINGRGEGAPLDIVLGIFGAMIGGWIFNTFGSAGVNGFNIWSLFVAIIGAAVLLVIGHAVKSLVSHVIGT
jgi:uncharacterized membrane protein YeaQ/YmgE (transglycosylase-associated protein family)